MGIGIITNFKEDLINIDLGYRDIIDYKTQLFDISKSSFNIIDLIEVGDYVNGYKVMEIIEFPQKILITKMLICSLEPKEPNNLNKKDYAETWIENEDIKEILTKEQYNNNIYRIGE